MLTRYERYTFSGAFSNADVHWHLWNEVIEKMKSINIDDEHEMNNFTIEHLKRDVYDSMVENNVVVDDEFLHKSLCVLCAVEFNCFTCPLGICYKNDSPYKILNFWIREARNQRSGETRDYEETKRCIDKAIEIAKKIRDILYSPYRLGHNDIYGLFA